VSPIFLFFKHFWRLLEIWTGCWHVSSWPCRPMDESAFGRGPPPGLACTYFSCFFLPDSKIWVRHEIDRQKCYGSRNTGEFGNSANRIQWTMSRTRIRPKSRKSENFILPTRAILGPVVSIILEIWTECWHVLVWPCRPKYRGKSLGWHGPTRFPRGP